MSEPIQEEEEDDLAVQLARLRSDIQLASDVF